MQELQDCEGQEGTRKVRVLPVRSSSKGLLMLQYRVMWAGASWSSETCTTPRAPCWQRSRQQWQRKLCLSAFMLLTRIRAGACQLVFQAT